MAILVVKKDSPKANLDFNKLIHVENAGVFLKHIKPGVLIGIPALEFALAETDHEADEDLVIVMFLGLEIATLDSIKYKKEWNSKIDYQDRLSSSSHLFMKFLVVKTCRKDEIYLGTLKKGLPEDINDSVYFLPGAIILQ